MNLTELNEKLRSFCYVRRTKDEVLPDLPEKMVSILPVALILKLYLSSFFTVRHEYGTLLFKFNIFPETI